MLIQFDDPRGTDVAVVGGKAASLGRLSQAGFPVPPGFTVPTDAQALFFAAHDLDAQIARLLAGLDYDDAVALDAVTVCIRTLIEAHPVPPDLREAIEQGYRALGDDTYVAVRSSGTAEDLAEASFAGLHDTYLDIHGLDAVCDAIRRCWASMWTARATAYRQRGGFEHLRAQIAVVIQKMVLAEVAGVMFTGNPLTAATDEIVINASWGLGEGVVSGILTPDEYVLAIDTLDIRRQAVGEKEVQVVRAPGGLGTVRSPVPQAMREVLSLSAAKAVALAELGREVMAYYAGLPQDVEWALAEGQIYLLQSRPITGVEFTWDEDVDGWQTAPDNRDTVWSHTWAEQFLTGGITPLFSSMRSWESQSSWEFFAKVYGFEEITNVRWFKYRHATMYFNADAERVWQKRMWPPALRDLTNIPPAWQQEFAREKTSLVDIVRMWMRVHTLEPKYGLLSWMATSYAWIDGRIAEAGGMPDAELRRLSDRALRRECDRATEMVGGFFRTLWPPFMWTAPATLNLLNVILTKWCEGDVQGTFQDLIAGISDTLLVRETHALWDLADTVRTSPALTACLQQHRDGAFFAALEGFDEGRAFLARYRIFLHDHGHRGHADRDIYYARRIEDPAIDYLALRALQNAGPDSAPTQIEARLHARRKDATERVIARLTAQSFGGFKVEAFKAVLNYALAFLKFRDDERHFLDRMTFTKKRCYAEFGRRMLERGQIDHADDFYFLARHELYDLSEGCGSKPLAMAKIAARKRVFQRRLARTQDTPTFFKAGQVLQLETRVPLEGAADGALRGFGTSRGEVTGRARIVRSIQEIGTVEKDDILICNATDPGWMPVFPLIKGLVLETGGMLAHGSCLAREYGLPAVQLRNAIRLIDDGALIRVNGDSGEIMVMAPAQAA